MVALATDHRLLLVPQQIDEAEAGHVAVALLGLAIVVVSAALNVRGARLLAIAHEVAQELGAF